MGPRTLARASERASPVGGSSPSSASLGHEADRSARRRWPASGRFVADKTGLAPDLLTPVAHVVAAWGGEEGWTTVLDQYRSSTTPQDKVRYLTALSATRDPSLLARTLDLALGDEVRTQDAPLPDRGGHVQPGRWARWPGTGSSGTGTKSRTATRRRWSARILEGIALLVDPAVADAVHAFADSHDLPLAGPRLDQLLERMDINVALAARLQGTMAAALSP